MRTFTAAAIQLRAHDREDFSVVWPGICRSVADAASNGASMIVLPEGTIPAYVVGEARIDERLVEQAVTELRSLARRFRVVVVCGVVRTHASLTFNSALVVDGDGEIAGYADKTFLWHFDRRWFAASERIAPIRTSLGTLGVLVCADGRIPTIARALVDAGAELLAMPTAWVTSGRNPLALENVQADLFARVRARENDVPFVAANKCGVERSCVAYCGKSQIVDARGQVVALANQHDAQILAAEVTLQTPKPSRVSVLPTPSSQTHARDLVRIAITPYSDDDALSESMRVIEATHAVAPDAPARLDALNAILPTARVNDDVMNDPAAPCVYRRSGCQLLVWDCRESDAQWAENVARTRALELRMFVVVLDRVRERAYAIDPDGVVTAGTFGSYRVAGVAIDPLRTLQTHLAPGTDVIEGIERTARITQHLVTGTT